MKMKTYLYIALLLLLVACKPQNPSIQSTIVLGDSIYTQADFRSYGDYYNSGYQVYAIDLLSEGLVYDSIWHILGSGSNLFLSDIFVTKDCVDYLPAGIYQMDSVARELCFLRGMYFEGNVTGTYLLEIEEDQMQRITLFSSGTMTIDYEGDDILLDFSLYTEDSLYYHATYIGPVMYR